MSDPLTRVSLFWTQLGPAEQDESGLGPVSGRTARFCPQKTHERVGIHPSLWDIYLKQHKAHKVFFSLSVQTSTLGSKVLNWTCVWTTEIEEQLFTVLSFPKQYLPSTF